MGEPVRLHLHSELSCQVRWRKEPANRLARRILQSVAAGFLGKASFEGGTATAALGLALHFFIALSMAFAYFAASKQWPVLYQRQWICGIAYGLLLYLIMNFIVVPLSAAGHAGSKTMSNKSIRIGQLLLCSLLLPGGCDKPPAQASAVPPIKAVATLEEVMHGMVIPSAQTVWGASGTIYTAGGVEERKPKSENEWLLVEGQRHHANRGRKFIDDGGPRQRQGPLDGSRPGSARSRRRGAQGR